MSRKRISLSYLMKDKNNYVSVSNTGGLTRFVWVLIICFFIYGFFTTNIGILMACVIIPVSGLIFNFLFSMSYQMIELDKEQMVFTLYDVKFWKKKIALQFKNAEKLTLLVGNESVVKYAKQFDLFIETEDGLTKVLDVGRYSEAKTIAKCFSKYMKVVYSILFFLISFYSNGQSWTDTNQIGNLPIKYLVKSNGEKEIVRTIKYEDDTFYTEQILFFNSKQINKHVFYKNGEPHGLATFYWPNGELKQVSYWKNGLGEGLFKFYYNDGSLHQEYYMKNGLKNGLAFEYHTNGLIKRYGAFIMDKKNGEWIYKNEKGEISKILTYEMGELKSEKIYPE